MASKPSKQRKRSRQVERGSIKWPLITAGAVGVLGIGSAIFFAPTEQPMVRDQYASLEDCQADWGGDAGHCDQTGDAATVKESYNNTHSSTSSSLHSGSGTRSYWYGPMYYAGDRDGAIRQAWSGRGLSNTSSFTPGNRSIGRATVSRGGFGSSSHSFSSRSGSSSSSSS